MFDPTKPDGVAPQGARREPPAGPRLVTDHRAAGGDRPHLRVVPGPGPWGPALDPSGGGGVTTGSGEFALSLKQERLLYLPDESELGDQVEPSSVRGAEAQGSYAAYEAFSPAYEAAATSQADASAGLLALARSFQPTIVLWSHPVGFLLNSGFIIELRRLATSPTVVLIDMDPWAIRAPRLTSTTRVLAGRPISSTSAAPAVSPACFGERELSRVRYTYHAADGERFATPWSPTGRRDHDVVMIANRNRGRIPGSAVPGAWRRAQFAKLLEQQYGSRFALYGHGWEGNSSWRGPLAFDEQGEANRSAWVSAQLGPLPLDSELHLQSGTDLACERRTPREQLPARVRADVPPWFGALLGRVRRRGRRDGCGGASPAPG